MAAHRFYAAAAIFLRVAGETVRRTSPVEPLARGRPGPRGFLASPTSATNRRSAVRWIPCSHLGHDGRQPHAPEQQPAAKQADVVGPPRRRERQTAHPHAGGVEHHVGRDAEAAVHAGRIEDQQAGRLIKFYEEALMGYTYLEDPNAD